MKKQLKAIIASLCVFAVLLAAYFVIVTFFPEIINGGDGANEIKVTDKIAADIRRVEIKNPKSEYTILAFETATAGTLTYTIENAQDFKFNDSDLGNIALNISKYVADSVVDENAADLSPYGLDGTSVMARVKATYADGSSVTLLIGNETPTKEGYYVCEEGKSTVYSVSAGRGEVFLKEYNDFRDKTILPASGENFELLRGIRIERPRNGILEITRVTEEEAESGGTETMISQFRLIEPFANFVDNQIAVKRLMDPLYAVTMQKVIEDHPKDLAKYGLDNPYIIDVTMTSGVVHRVRIGHAIEGTETDEGDVSAFMMVDGVDSVYIVQGAFDFMLVDARDLLNTIIWSHDIKSVAKLIFDDGNKSYTMIIKDKMDYEGNGTFFCSLDGKTLDEQTARLLFMRMIQVMGEDRVSADYAPPDKADYTMKMVYNNGKEYNLRLMKINSRHYAAEVDGFTNYYINVSSIKRILDSLDLIEKGSTLE